jgi:nitrite reductase/ring-hydroxylating ferredoxin subunit
MQEYKITRLQDLKNGKGFLARVKGEEIALFKIDGKIYAACNVCPHQHFSKLHEGIIEQKTVTCPMHGWKYDLETGKSVNAAGMLKMYDVSIRGDDVFIIKNGDVD